MKDKDERLKVRLTKIYLSIWPFIIVVISLIIIGITISVKREVNILTLLVLLETALLPFHVLEEWLFPGGFHFMYNVGMKSDIPDRYPLNRLSDMWTNSVGIAFGIIFLLIGVNKIIAMIELLLCVVEILAHGISGVLVLKKLRQYGKKTIYNPGLITVVFGYFPLSVCYIRYFIIDGFPSLLELLLSFISFLLLAFLAIVLPEKLCKSRETPYGFDRGPLYFKKYEEYLK